MPSGAILWEGASRFDGTPIVVIATGIRGLHRSGDHLSNNEKTGPMGQVWILPAIAPMFDAVYRTGEDSSVCGSCPLRRFDPSGNMQDRECYVRIHGPAAVQGAYQRGAYPRMSPREVSRLLCEHDQNVRLGAYGDPGMVPLRVWQDLTAEAPGWTGYTHRWRGLRHAWTYILMASCDTPEERELARARGWRTFRVGQSPAPGEILCPASIEAGKKTTCDRCKLCNGRQVGDVRKDIHIPFHGPMAAKHKERT